MTRMSVVAAVTAVVGIVQASSGADVRPDPMYGASGAVAHTRSEGTRFPGGTPVIVFDDDTYRETLLNGDGRGHSAINYPLGGSFVPEAHTGAGAGAAGHAMAKIDVPAGELRVYAAGWVACGENSQTYGWSQAYARAGLNDVLILDKPARVTIAAQVPEPACMGLLATPALLLLRRRKV